jgi:hypothetical protein
MRQGEKEYRFTGSYLSLEPPAPVTTKSASVVEDLLRNALLILAHKFEKVRTFYICRHLVKCSLAQLRERPSAQMGDRPNGLLARRRGLFFLLGPSDALFSWPSGQKIGSPPALMSKREQCQLVGWAKGKMIVCSGEQKLSNYFVDSEGLNN